MLGHLLSRLSHAEQLDRTIVAIAQDEGHKEIAREVRRLQKAIPKLAYQFGPTHKVLDRYYYALLPFELEPNDLVVRVTSDCPCADPALIDSFVSYAKETSESFDYWSNTTIRTFPKGFDVEIFKYQSLMDRFNMDYRSPHETEHVTSGLRADAGAAQRAHTFFNELGDFEHFRATLDYPEDYRLLKALIETLPSGYTQRDVIKELMWLHHQEENFTDE
jgi:spore coat polysaccharide biosynthesis protein SpsF